MQSSLTHAVSAAAVRLPRRPAHRALVVVRAASEGPEGWQVSKLKQAYAAGRRQVEVSRDVIVAAALSCFLLPRL